MPAGTHDILIEQGSTFEYPLVWRDAPAASGGVAIDITGYTARAQIRTAFGTPETLANMTTENGGITLGGAAGTITLLLTAAQTAAMPAAAGVWDLEMVAPSGKVQRLLKGTVTVDPEVTRD